jgi:hypothetical protein
MGVDACIFIKVKDGARDIRLERPLPDRFSLAPRDGEMDKDWFPDESTHEVDNPCRFYGPGYERGPWPTLCGVLMVLLNSPDIETVWYFGDDLHTGDLGPFTVDRLIQYTRHYVEYGERGWYGPWKGQA